MYLKSCQYFFFQTRGFFLVSILVIYSFTIHTATTRHMSLVVYWIILNEDKHEWHCNYYCNNYIFTWSYAFEKGLANICLKETYQDWQNKITFSECYLLIVRQRLKDWHKIDRKKNHDDGYGLLLQVLWNWFIIKPKISTHSIPVQTHPIYSKSQI